jgi:hypothetical protein
MGTALLPGATKVSLFFCAGIHSKNGVQRAKTDEAGSQEDTAQYQQYHAGSAFHCFREI